MDTRPSFKRWHGTTLERRLWQPVVWLLMACSVLAVGLSNADAADRFKPDDQVEVKFLNSWTPAVVIAVNKRGEVMAEFQFANTTKREVFQNNDVRFPYEADALIAARIWTDTSGQFRQMGALLAIADGKITIRKPDLAEIQVPIDKLSAADQKLIKSLEKQLPQVGPKPPPVEDFGDGPGSFGGVIGSAPKRVALEPDPLPDYKKLVQGGVGFPQEQFFDQMGAVLPVGGPDGWLLAAVENGDPANPLPTRLIWASLARQKLESVQMLPPGEVLLDYHPPSHRVLSCNYIPDSNSREVALTLWEVLPTDKTVTPVTRWRVSNEWSPDETWAKLVDGKIVVHRNKRHEFVLWDVEQKKKAFVTNHESFFAPLPTLSSNRRYLIIPEDKQVRILEAATGAALSVLPVTDGASAATASEDGRRLAVLGRTSLTIWDLTSDSAEPRVYQAESVGTPFTSRLYWVGDNQIMAETNFRQLVLFSMQHEITLWNYQFDSDANQSSSGLNSRDIVNEHLVYSARVRSGSQTGLAIGAVKLPGPKVDELAANIDRASLLIVKQGTPVRLAVSAGQFTARVQAALEKKIQENGWVLSPTATTVLAAEMKQGQLQQVTYELSGFGGARGRETVSVTPFISDLKLYVGDKIAWQSGTSTGAPPVVFLREGQTAQAEVNSWQRPQPEFFEQVAIPQNILDPAKRDGLGSTEVTNRGLVPKN